MGFLAPLALALTALSLPILAFYLLKLRRTEQVVSSTFLWQQVLRDRQANAPWQKLRRNLLLLLQLLALLLLVVALARPYNQTTGRLRGNVVVLLDASASMQATDVSPTRFEAALRQAERLIADLGANDTMTLISVGDVPHVLSLATGDRSVLRRALSDAAPTNGEADWAAAFILAAASAQQAPHSTIVILSDGGLPADLPDLPGEVRYQPVGTTDDNRAVTALAIRDTPAGPQAFVRILNASAQAARTLVEIDVDGSLYDARTLDLPGESEASFTVRDLPDVQSMEVRLEGGDALALDDWAWAVRATQERSTAVLATEGNLFLERALGLIPNLDLVTTQVTGTFTLETSARTPLSPTLYVLDGVLPDRLPSQGSLFLLHPPAENDLLESCGQLAQPRISYVDTSDPLLSHVDLGGVHIADAACIEAPSWARTLVAAGDRPLLLAGEVGGRRIAVLAFDLHRSDLPLQVAFPVLIANLSNWLAPPSVSTEDAALHPGDPVTLRPMVGSTAVTVETPSGERTTYTVEGEEPISFADTQDVGLYVVEQQVGGQAQRSAFAVNLFSEDESRIAPREEIAVGSATVVQTEAPPGRREWWRWPALAALIVLVIEWAVDKR
jgi:Ca-activated chloride channel family protein